MNEDLMDEDLMGESLRQADEDQQMKTIDDVMVREWVDLDLDGELGPDDKTRLASRLEESADLQTESRLLASLHAMIAESRVPVRAGFQDRVMSALPAAAWERRLGEGWAPAWALPVAVAAIFAVGAALALGSASGGPESHALGIFAAVFDFVQTTTLAGAGLLFATWRGVGFGLEEAIAGSGLNLLALASAVVFLNLFFIQLLRRRPATVRQAAGRRRD